MPELILYTISETAKILKCSECTVRRHIHGYIAKKGERQPVDLLPVRMVGTREYRIEQTVLDVFTNRYNDWSAYQRVLRQYSSLRKSA